MHTSSILIVSYTFPPSQGIGGRRWAKFAKLLKQKGHLVKVIAAWQHSKEESEWTKDISGLEHDITFIKSYYPEILGKRPGTISEKIRYRVALAYVKLFSKGNYYDKSIFWKKNLLDACRETIRENKIRNLICTIGPFRTSSFILELKSEFPDLNLILDYRDPWTNNLTSFGFELLSLKRLAYEKDLEKKVLETYDKILVVSSHMAPYLDEISNSTRSLNITEVTNGFDNDDFPSFRTEEKEKGTVKIVFAGTFYEKALHVFLHFLESLQKINADEKNLNLKKLRFIFLGQIATGMEKAFEQYPEHLQFIGRKKLSETYQEIASADFCALFLSDDLTYSMSTKFYEYMGMRKPIILFAKNHGPTARFLEENGLGIAIDFNNTYEQLVKILTPGYSVQLKNDQQANQFDVRQIVGRIEQLLN